LIVRVKYCGGCNPSYDRPAFVRRLRDALPSARFVFSDAGADIDDSAPDFALAVCGCPVACAAREDIQGSRGCFAVTSQSDFTSARNQIRRAEAPPRDNREDGSSL
jgi:hypothetical protein